MPEKKIVDQKVLTPNVFIPDLILDPFTPHVWTNNFIQQTFSRLFGYDQDNKKWRSIRVTEHGRLKIQSDYTHIYSRNSVTYHILSSETLPAGAILVTPSMRVRQLSKKQLFVRSSGSFTIYIQFSPDNTYWYDWYDTNNNLVYFSVSGDARSWAINDQTEWVRFVIDNTAGSATTVSMWLTGQV